MFIRIICFAFVLNVVRCVGTLDDELEDVGYNAGNAPFFELPCMIVGGTCARSVACPPGTKVGSKGLCPVQQEHGMECCKPSPIEVKCRSRGGNCVSSTVKCPQSLLIKGATDCEKYENCCVLSK